MVLNKDPTVWIDGARPPLLVLLVLPLPENEFGKVIYLTNSEATKKYRVCIQKPPCEKDGITLGNPILGWGTLKLNLIGYLKRYV